MSFIICPGRSVAILSLTETAMVSPLKEMMEATGMVAITPF